MDGSESRLETAGDSAGSRAIRSRLDALAAVTSLIAAVLWVTILALVAGLLPVR